MTELPSVLRSVYSLFFLSSIPQCSSWAKRLIKHISNHWVDHSRTNTYTHDQNSHALYRLFFLIFTQIISQFNAFNMWLLVVAYYSENIQLNLFLSIKTIWIQLSCAEQFHLKHCLKKRKRRLKSLTKNEYVEQSEQTHIQTNKNTKGRTCERCERFTYCAIIGGAILLF